MDHKQEISVYRKELVKIVEEIDLRTFCFLNLSISKSIIALAYLMEKRMGSIRIIVNIHGEVLAFTLNGMAILLIVSAFTL